MLFFSVNGMSLDLTNIHLVQINYIFYDNVRKLYICKVNILHSNVVV